MLRIKDFEELSGSTIWNGEKIKKIKFKGVAIDSRVVKKSELFIAVKGENTDGHKYLKDVFKRGVKAAVIESKFFNRVKQEFKNKTFIVVPDTIKALGELARNHKNKTKPPVFCIGGSNGKTTTKDLVAAVLSEKYNVLKTEGNFNNHIGLPLTLLRLQKKHNFCVLEVGCSHFGEINYLCEIAEPDYGMITNIGKEHLEFFKNERGVAKAEFELYDYLRNKENKVCFFNIDDKYISRYARNVKNKYTYGYTNSPDTKGKFKEYNKNFEPVITAGKLELTISTFGKHSIFNGLAAAAAGFYFGVAPSKIKTALGSFKQASSKRMEVTKHNGVIYINDAYNSNPNSVKMGLETLKEHKTKGSKHVVLADMLELGSTSKKEHSEIGKLAASMGFKNLYTYGKESYNTFKAAKKIKKNFYFENKEDMASVLRSVIREGDIVYLKGSRGMKMEEVLNQLVN
jgi:UDP-N-acetylmuramoyl-tripeptide--D-alanyl-D-alanine ligase